jgi:hypothetical protein
LSDSRDLQNNSYIHAAGDVDNDGLMDFVITDYQANYDKLPYVYRTTYTGSNGQRKFYAEKAGYSASGDYGFYSSDVYVVYGKELGLGDLSVNSSSESANLYSSYSRLSSNSIIDAGFGNQAGSLGDFDGDGVSDLLIGAGSAKSWLKYTEGQQNLRLDYWSTGPSSSSASYGYTDWFYNTVYWTSDEWSASSVGRQYFIRGGNDFLNFLIAQLMLGKQAQALLH